MDLVYTIKRSARRRKLTITVERDRRVIVHAPAGTAEEKIHQVVESKRQWIFEKIGHPQKYHDLPHPPGKELVSGESACTWAGNTALRWSKKGCHRFSSPSVSLFRQHMGKNEQRLCGNGISARQKKK